MGRNRIPIERIKNDKIRNVNKYIFKYNNNLFLFLFYFQVNIHETKSRVGQKGHGTVHPLWLWNRPGGYQSIQQAKPLLQFRSRFNLEIPLIKIRHSSLPHKLRRKEERIKIHFHFFINLQFSFLKKITVPKIFRGLWNHDGWFTRNWYNPCHRICVSAYDAIRHVIKPTTTTTISNNSNTNNSSNNRNKLST